MDGRDGSRVAASRAAAGVTVLAGAGALLVPPAVGDVYQAGVGLVVAVAALAALRHHRPPVTTGWPLLGVGLALFCAAFAGGVADVRLAGGTTPGAAAAVVGTLTSLALMATGVARVFRSADRRRDVASALDAAILLVTAGHVGFAWLVEPVLRDDADPAAAVLQAATLVAVVGVAAFLLRQLRHPSLLTGGQRLLALGVACAAVVTVRDAVAPQSAARISGASSALPVIVLALGLAAAALLHPSTRRPWRLPSRPAHPGLVRLAAVASVLYVPLLLQVLGPPDRTEADEILWGVVAVTLVVVRVLHTLRAREARFRALVEHASDGISVTDSDGVIRFATPAVEAMLGVPVAELVGTSVLDRVAPADAGAAAEALGRVLAEPGSQGEGLFRVVAADGAERWLRYRAHNLVEDPAVGGLVVNYHDVTAEQLAHLRLTHEATRDALTGLHNRRSLLQALDEAVVGANPGAEVSLLFLDVDRFKVINDSLGHEAGDQLLVEVAERLRRAVREGDVVARLGGDEFVVLCRTGGDRTAALLLAGRLADALAEPFDLGGAEVVVTASIGLASAEDADRGGAELLRDADVAMYRAKAAGRDRVEVFTAALRDAAVTRLADETALRHAIGAGELHLAYQPIVDLGTGRVVDVEALVRWSAPDRGPLDPATFVALAEETGQIAALGRFVLEHAAAELAAWRTGGVGRDGVGLAVNVSPLELQAGDYVEGVRAVLERTGLPPAALRLELTERVLVDDSPRTSEVLRGLHALGVRISVDDFGTGWSSLAYLKRVPCDVVKVDRSFTDGLGRDEGDTQIVTAIIGMAHGLHLDVVAEGVETEAQVAHLRALGCDQAQGYHFSPPLPFAELAPALEGDGRLVGP